MCKWISKVKVYWRKILLYIAGISKCSVQFLCKNIEKAPARFELTISCLLDRRFNQLSHGASRYCRWNGMENYFYIEILINMWRAWSDGFMSLFYLYVHKYYAMFIVIKFVHAKKAYLGCTLRTQTFEA